jgi:hypothetical protein
MEKGEPTVPSSRPSRAGRPPSRPRSREEREEWDAAHEDEIAIENEKVDRILERRGRAAERAEKRLPEKIAREWTLTKTEAAIFFALVKVVLKPFGRVYYYPRQTPIDVSKLVERVWDVRWTSLSDKKRLRYRACLRKHLSCSTAS